MADELDSLVNNVKSSSTWLRILFMLGFCVVLYVVSVVLVFLVGAQALFSLFTGADNRNLRLLGLNLTEYVNQILRFLTYNSETRPFPFNPFPQLTEASEAEPENSAAGQTAGNDEPEGGGNKEEKATSVAAKKIAGGAASKKTRKKSASTSRKPVTGKQGKASGGGNGAKKGGETD